MKEYSPSKFSCDLASISMLGFENGLTGKDKPIDFSELNCGDKETFDAWSKIYCSDMERICNITEEDINGLHPKNVVRKLLKWILGIRSPSLGRRVTFKDVFSKYYLG